MGGKPSVFPRKETKEAKMMGKLAEANGGARENASAAAGRLALKAKLFIATALFLFAFGANMVFHVFNPFNIGISPLIAENGRERTGRRLEISFAYDRLILVASNQFAIWIEDMFGNHVATLYVTRYTAQVGHRRRPQSISGWVSAAQPGNMRRSELDAVAGATPRPGNYVVIWDLTDGRGNLVAGAEFRYFVKATMYIDDDVVYSGVIRMGEERWAYYPVPEFSNPHSELKAMIANVRVAFYPN